MIKNTSNSDLSIKNYTFDNFINLKNKSCGLSRFINKSNLVKSKSYDHNLCNKFENSLPFNSSPLNSKTNSIKSSLSLNIEECFELDTLDICNEMSKIQSYNSRRHSLDIGYNKFDYEKIDRKSLDQIREKITYIYIKEIK